MTSLRKRCGKQSTNYGKKFVPQFVKMKNQSGTHVPLVQRAETIAEYLANEHWKNISQENVSNTSKIVEDNDAPIGNFSIEALNEAIKSTKSNKQPGPDGIVMELIKWLDRDNRLLLLTLINTWWSDRKAPQDLFFARVVPIYKCCRKLQTYIALKQRLQNLHDDDPVPNANCSFPSHCKDSVRFSNRYVDSSCYLYC